MTSIGFSVDTVVYKNKNLTVWDLGGQKKIRDLWHHYYQNMQAIIYILDSNDAQRLSNISPTYNKTEEITKIFFFFIFF